MTRIRPAVLVTAALALTLAACNGDDEPGPTGTATGPTATATETTDAPDLATQQRATRYLDSEVDVEVGPVVVEGADAYVRVASRVTDGPTVDAIGMYPERTPSAEYGPGQPLRVLDLADGRTHDATAASAELTAPITPDGETVWFARVDGEGLDAGESVAVMLTSVGIVEDVAVLAPGDDGAFDPADVSLAAASHAWTQGATGSLEAFSLALDNSSDTTVTEERVEVNVSADVLFAVDSADLSPQATTVLQDVVRQLDAYPGGTLEIVGHTDDVADDAYNQALSERRAASVHDALGALTDLGRFQVTVVGKGESEPRIPETTPEARQANRRVEILVTPTGETETTLVEGTAPIPDPTGASGPGDAGVLVTEPNGSTVRLAIDEVRRVDGYLLGELQVTAESGPQSLVTSLMSFGGRVFGGQAGPAQTADALTLLAPGQRVAPLQYQLPSTEARFVAADKYSNPAGLQEGQTQVLSFVWPDTGQDTVTLAYEYFQRTDTAPFRLTDVPVRGD